MAPNEAFHVRAKDHMLTHSYANLHKLINTTDNLNEKESQSLRFNYLIPSKERNNNSTISLPFISPTGLLAAW